MCLQNLAQIYLQGFWMFPYLTQGGWRFEIWGQQKQQKSDVCYIFGTPFVPLERILLVDTTVRLWNVGCSLQEEHINKYFQSNVETRLRTLTALLHEPHCTRKKP